MPGPLDVRLRCWLCRVVSVATRSLLDEVEELLRDDRVVRRRRAPDPLFAWSDERSADAFVVAAPDVVAGVFGVAEHRLELRAAPGLLKRHLVLAVARWW